MSIAVIADSKIKEELISANNAPVTQITWLDEPASVPGADCYIDLLFDQQEERVHLLSQLPAPLVIIDDVYHHVNTPEHFVRVNAWPTLLKRNITEASGPEHLRQRTSEVFRHFGKEITWLPAQPGFVTPRVISMIVNEAYLALDEKVSSRDDIDTAMKLGTNYPFGPFEWSSRIGLQRIHLLLERLSATNARYKPAALLTKEATRS